MDRRRFLASIGIGVLTSALPAIVSPYKPYVVRVDLGSRVEFLNVHNGHPLRELVLRGDFGSLYLPVSSATRHPNTNNVGFDVDPFFGKRVRWFELWSTVRSDKPYSCGTL